MKIGKITVRRAWAAAIPVGLLAISSLASSAGRQETPPQKPASSEHKLLAVAPPPFSDGIFPCSDCHSPDDEVDRTPRVVDAHEDIVFEHDAENRWCLDCHSAENRDMLHLASGKLVDFKESYKLCGQCHGPKLRDWKAGDHGKRTGSWNGEKQYLLCVHCHNPHSPSIKKITPKPPPIHQGARRK